MERPGAFGQGDDWLMIFSLAQVMQWLLHYKYFVLFPVMVVEGPIVTIIAGFLSSSGYLNIFVAYVVVVIGDLVGDSIYYAGGRWGRKRFVSRWGRYVGVTIERIMQLQEYFAKHKAKTLIVAKLSHAIGAPVLVAAGVANVPYWQFVGINFLATLPKSLVLLLIGFYFGRGYARISEYLDYTALGMIALAALLIMLYLMKKKIHKNLSNKE